MVIFYPEPGEIDSVKGKKNCFFGQCLSKPRKQPAFAGVRPSLLHFFIALKKQVNMMIKELQSRIRFFQEYFSFLRTFLKTGQVSWKSFSSLSFKGIGNKKFVNFSGLSDRQQLVFQSSADRYLFWILFFGVRRVWIGKSKLIDIGLRRHSLDIEQIYWTVISGHWMVL